MTWKTYRCEKCGESQEVRLESIHDERPDSVPCIKEGCDGKAVYDYGELVGSSTIIPDSMRAVSVNSNAMKYNKISRDNKRLY